VDGREASLSPKESLGSLASARECWYWHLAIAFRIDVFYLELPVSPLTGKLNLPSSR